MVSGYLEEEDTPEIVEDEAYRARRAAATAVASAPVPLLASL
jgi:hypothetical protein